METSDSIRGALRGGSSLPFSRRFLLRCPVGTAPHANCSFQYKTLYFTKGVFTLRNVNSQLRNRLSTVQRSGFYNRVAKRNSNMNRNVTYVLPTTFGTPRQKVMRHFYPARYDIQNKDSNRNLTHRVSTTRATRRPTTSHTVKMVIRKFAKISVNIGTHPHFPSNNDTLFSLVRPTKNNVLRRRLMDNIHVTVLYRRLARRKHKGRANIRVTTIFRRRLIRLINHHLTLHFIRRPRYGNASVFALPIKHSFSIFHGHNTMNGTNFFHYIAMLHYVLYLTRHLYGFYRGPPKVDRVHHARTFTQIRRHLRKNGTQLAPFTMIRAIRGHMLNMLTNLLLLNNLLNAARRRHVPLLRRLMIIYRSLTITNALVGDMKRRGNNVTPTHQRTRRKNRMSKTTNKQNGIYRTSVQMLIRTTFNRPFFRRQMTIRRSRTNLSRRSRVTHPTNTLTNKTINKSVTRITLLTPRAILRRLARVHVTTPGTTNRQRLQVSNVNNGLYTNRISIHFRLYMPRPRSNGAKLVIIFTLFTSRFRRLYHTTLFITIPILGILLYRITILIRHFTTRRASLLAFINDRLRFCVTYRVLPRVRGHFSVKYTRRPTHGNFLLPSKRNIRTGRKRHIKHDPRTIPTNRFSFPPNVMRFTLLRVILTSKTTLNYFRNVIQGTSHLTVRFRLRRSDRFLTRRITIAVRTKDTTMPTVTRYSRRFVLTKVGGRYRVMNLCPGILIYNGTTKDGRRVTSPLTIRPYHVRALNNGVRPLAFSYQNYRRLTRVTYQAIKLVQLHHTFTKNFRYDLLLLPIKLYGNISYVNTVSVQLFHFQTSPRTLPINGKRAHFGSNFTPHAKLIIFVPRPSTPLSLHLKQRENKHFNIRRATRSLSTYPRYFDSNNRFSFMNNLTRAFYTLPQWGRHPNVCTRELNRVVHFRIYYLRRLRLLFPFSLYSWLWERSRKVEIRGFILSIGGSYCL